MLNKKDVEKKLERDLENIYVEEEKKKISKPIMALIVFFILLLLSGLAGLFVYFFCEVRTINVTGNTILVEEEIRQDLIVDEYDKNAVLLILRNKFMPRKDIPFVESMKMSMSDLHTVNVKVKEKPITGYIRGKKRYRIYYDTEGTVMEVSRVKVKGAVLTVPKGKVGEAVVGEPLPIRAKSLRELVALNHEFFQNDIKVSRITITEEGNFILNYKNITIKFGTASYMAEKVTRLKVILPKIKKKEGILHLEDWSECTTDIVFEMLDKETIKSVIEDETSSKTKKDDTKDAVETEPAGEGTTESAPAGSETPASQTPAAETPATETPAETTTEAGSSDTASEAAETPAEPAAETPAEAPAPAPAPAPSPAEQETVQPQESAPAEGESTPESESVQGGGTETVLEEEAAGGEE